MQLSILKTFPHENWVPPNTILIFLGHHIRSTISALKNERLCKLKSCKYLVWENGRKRRQIIYDDIFACFLFLLIILWLPNQVEGEECSWRFSSEYIILIEFNSTRGDIQHPRVYTLQGYTVLYTWGIISWSILARHLGYPPGKIFSTVFPGRIILPGVGNFAWPPVDILVEYSGTSWRSINHANQWLGGGGDGAPEQTAWQITSIRPSLAVPDRRGGGGDKRQEDS